MQRCNRRNFLKILGGGAFAAALSARPAWPAETRKPNVLLIFTDDQGTLDAGCYGSDDLYTPAMDGLARTGVRFTQAYSHTVCCPARALLLTGRHPQRSGIINWTQSDAHDAEPGLNMPKAEVTLAEVLKEAGYATALFGKWHLGADLAHGPLEQGFDHFYGHRGGFIDNYKHYFLHQKGFHDLYEGKREVFARGSYFPDLVTQRAEQFIEAHRDRPFFMYLAFNIPHYPEQADAQFAARYRDLPEPRRSYAQMISTVDDRIGRVVAKLAASGLREDTIIIFMSDNGHSTETYKIKAGDHASGLPLGHDYGPHGGGGNTGKWRGMKGNFFEGGLRVPAIISYPRALPQGIVREQAITGADWYPTVLALCGVAAPKVKLDGKSLLPIIESASAPTRHKVMHWQWQAGWAVRRGNWKLINDPRNPQKMNEAKVFLGRLDGDAPEAKNYAGERPELVAELTKLHEAWTKEVTPSGG